MNFSFRPVDPAADAALLHSWMRRDYARFWGMTHASASEVQAEYTGIAVNPHHQAWLAQEEGVPAFLAESYDPAHSPLAGSYPIQPGDLGMHVLMGPPDRPRSGYTTAALEALLDFLFENPAVERIVVEPDVRNTKIHVLNARMGFEPQSRIELPDKTALLSFCTRAQFRAARRTTPADSQPKGASA